MSAIATKIVTGHTETSPGWNDYHQVVWLGESVYRDSIGRRNNHGYHRFAVVKCNNPECLFEALVNAEVIVEQLTDA